MNKKSLSSVFKGVMWFITTFWFGYMSAVILWNIDKTSWMITLDFNHYGEAIVEIPIFFISTLWLIIYGTKRVATHLEEASILDGLFDRVP